MSAEKGYIERALDAYVARADARFHTPGHKGKYNARDITEVGVGGDIFPADAVERAERSSARLYGVAHMRYLTHGSSQGIKAALLAFKGKKILYAPGVHRAFTEGCELADIRAVPIGHDACGKGMVYTCGCGDLPTPLTVADAAAALDLHKDAAALFLTSPDYLGRVADLRIAALCKQRGVCCIVDAAHGAHFAFAPDLQACRFETVADICNMSAHKTLGAYTQTALLAVSDAAPLAAIENALLLLGTTSPNYALLERLEKSVTEASEQSERYAALKAFYNRLAQKADLLPNTDYTRLCVRPKKGTAKDLFAAAVERGVMPEAVIGDYAVFILTPYDTEETKEKLFNVLVR